MASNGENTVANGEYTVATWLVGASTGIGAALIKELDAPGSLLFVSARNLANIRKTFARYAARIIPLEMDVVDEWSVQQAQAQILTHTQRLDRVIINAGTCEYIDSYDIDLASVKRVMDTNFFGALHVINASLPLLRHALQPPSTRVPAGPQLVLISSSVTYQALPRAGAYGASKSAIRYMMECLKLDLQHEGLDVRVVSPGFVKTPLTDKNDFPMPFRISAEEAAQRIVKGLNGRRFDVHFPKRFTLLLKAMSWLPDCVRFPLVGKSSRHEVDKLKM
jgi:NAD(P)-dependent dehydrogenase (short-subunit alcohol dehydrogenase family)